MLHEQAIYQHDGEQYQVEELDYDNHKAYVKKVVPDYFTTRAHQPQGHAPRRVDRDEAVRRGRRAG
jgi:ATP-dependent helicase YprA (DUF1998 family)